MAYKNKTRAARDKILEPADAIKFYCELGQLKLNVLEANRQKVSDAFYDDCMVSFACEKLELPILLPKHMLHQKKNSLHVSVKMFGKDHSLLYGIFNRRLVPKIKDGQNVLLSRKSIDKLYKTFNILNAFIAIDQIIA